MSKSGMPRERRIEYAGAIYHALARGDRREDIVADDQDRDWFEKTLAETVTRSGWELYAWVLMSNHYHLVFKTPEANLVKGMTWLQNTWTRRFNARHRLWGHVFASRYKAILVEEGEYLTRLIHYVHLNPVRAGLVRKVDGIESYRWGSLIDYVRPRRKRRGWVAAAEGLSHLDFPDTARGRLKLLEWTEELIDWGKPQEAGSGSEDGGSLQSTLRRGWYFGTENFREKLLRRLGKAKAESFREKRRKGYSGEQTRDYGKAQAERIVKLAGESFGLSASEWAAMKKGDWRKGIVAGLIRERSLVSNRWVAERLHMGAPGAISRTIREARTKANSDPKTRKVVRALLKNVESF